MGSLRNDFRNEAFAALFAGASVLIMKTPYYFSGARVALFVLLSCAPGALASAAPGKTQAQTLHLGTRTITTSLETDLGTPVIPMWKAQMPKGSQGNAFGLPVLQDAQHFDVWKPARREEGAYNHYSALIFHNGRFYAMWGNQPYGENGPGQRVLFTTSKDGHAWNPPSVFFTSPGPVFRAAPGDKNKALYLVPDRWVEVDGKLYGVAYVGGAGGISYPIARELKDDGSLGEPFLLRDLPAKDKLPLFMTAPKQDPALAAKIKKWYEDNDMISWWAKSAGEIPLHGIDDAKLIESFAFRSKDGMVICMRDYTPPDGNCRPSNRIYACFPDGKGGWSPLYPTDIPDSPSRAQALRLPDGRVLLAGNQIAPKLDSGLYMPRDPLTLSVSPDGEFFTKVFALRSGGSAKHTPRFSGITGRAAGTAYGYPSMIVHDGMIYVLYSVNKEDIAISMVPLASMQDTENSK